MRLLWFITLLSAICLEGLGRKYMPSIPSVFFYFFKDVVLVSGYFILRPPLEVRNAARWLFRGFTPIVVGGVVWTVLEVFNPEQQSLPLALTGLRAYWLWWLAPVLVASSLRVAKEKRRAIYALLVMSLGIAALATVQFGSPPTSTVNLYSTVDGEQVFADRATVSIDGPCPRFIDVQLLERFLRLHAADPRAVCCRSVSRSRTRSCGAPVGGGTASARPSCPCPVHARPSSSVAWSWSSRPRPRVSSSRHRQTCARGRPHRGGAGHGGVPRSVRGRAGPLRERVRDQHRILETLAFLPPVALMTFDYPLMGIGTGMQQNARASFGVRSDYEAETEVGRYLIELGPIGFLLVWLARFAPGDSPVSGLHDAEAGRARGGSGAALSYATLTFLGNFAFDHIFQALFFLGCGFILSEVVEVHALGALAAAGMTPVAERR